MSRRSWIFGKTINLIFMLVVLLCVYADSTFAAEREIVRVGYFNMGGYFHINDHGKLTGYDVDFLDELENHSNLRFEYVSCGTWFEAVKKMKAGEIDLIGSTQWTPEREEEFEFCLQSYGLTVGEIVSLPGNHVTYEDYKAIGNMRIGCLFNNRHTVPISELLAKHDAYPRFVYYPTQRALIEALKTGDVDAVASYAHVLDQKWSVIEKFLYTPYYFISRKGNEDLTDKIDAAIIRTQIENPEFDDKIIKKWFPSMQQIPLTKAEQDYIDELKSISFAFCTNEGYLCRTEKGGYVGIGPSLAKEICRRLGVEFKEVQFSYPQLLKELTTVHSKREQGNILVEKVKAMGIDVWGDFFYNQDWADTLGVGITGPYMNATYYQIKRKGDVIGSSSKIAAVRGLRYTADIVADYKPENIVWCDDFESCMQAVNSGDADFTVINTYAAEYYLAMYQFNGLAATLIEFTNQSSMAIVRDKDGLLRSAIDKTIKSISPEEMDALILNETSKMPEQNMLMAFLYTHSVTAVLFSCATLAVFMLLGFMYYSMRKAKEQNELLIKATNAKSEFLAKMSHDIRTPMNAIINLTDMVDQEIEDKEAARKDIQKIRNSNEFLLSLINDILDTSRIEEGKLELKRQIYYDSQVLEYLHSTFDKLAKDKNIEFKIEAEESRIPVFTDRARFNQICFNLVSNAIKYTPDNGHVNFKMTYAPLTPNSLPVDIYVKDDGIGMSDEFMKKAYVAFSQENRQYMTVEGTGLGLSIVKQIVDRMGGTIEMESKENKGTTVHVHLDLELADEKAVAEELARHKDVAVDYGILKGKCILVAEDHPLNQKIIGRLLEKEGIKVLLAKDGREAVEIFREKQASIDAILMDIRMPVMDGLEAAETIRGLEIPRAKTVPIIAVSANAYAEDIQKSLRAGMNAHVTKPIEPKVLYTTLKSNLE